MRIYAVADIHSRPRHLSTIRKAVSENTPDIVVAAGDLGSWIRPDAALDALSRLPVPVLAVRGNSDSRGLFRRIADTPNIHDIHLTPFTVNGVRMVGVGGTVPLPFRSKVALRESRLVDMLAPLVTSQSVLVAHPPPYGIQDRVLGRFHAGSSGLRRLIALQPPAVLICGHIHEQAGISRRDGTLVVNCSLGRTCAGALIEYDGHGRPEARVL